MTITHIGVVNIAFKNYGSPLVPNQIQQIKNNRKNTFRLFFNPCVAVFSVPNKNKLLG
jgi:hypothetical protein